MTLALAEMLTTILGVHFGLGALFALVFVIWGAPRIDEAAKGMPVQARMIIFPAAMILWPLMLVKTLTKSGPPLS
ncbi:MAG: hypothetical protein AAGB25_09015 [Pseudomonadota bacterium]